MSVRILIGADVAPFQCTVDEKTPARSLLHRRRKHSSYAYLQREDVASPYYSGDGLALLGGALHQRWFDADIRIFDLEVPLYDGAMRIEKCGPALAAAESSVRGLAALKPSLVTLANNHILDCGEAGLTTTLRLLDENGIRSVGAGENLAAAAEPKLLERDGLSIGILAVCESEFSIAGETRCGASPFDPLETPDAVRALKKRCDHVIVLYHGGPENWGYPTVQLMKRLRKLAACGASAVICQHGHCVGAYETYAGVPIVYGQGNFLFAADDGEPCWQTGLLVELVLHQDGVAIDFLPIEQTATGCRLSEGETAERTLTGFRVRSKEILSPAIVQEQTALRAKELRRMFGRALIGSHPLLRIWNILTGRRPLERLYDGGAKRTLINFLRCETLHELFLDALER